MATCARPGCDNELKTGRTYCSTSCAAQVREAGKKSIHRLSETLEAGIGQQASRLVVDEVGRYLMEGQVPAVLTEGVTYGQWVLNFDGTQDYRPDDRLSFDKIELMLKNGSVIFAMMMKLAQIVSVFSEGRYKVECPDKEIEEVAMASLKYIMPKMAYDFCYSALAFGTSFQEETWEWRSKYELGLSKSRSAGTMFQVPKVPNSVHPKTINHIIRDSKGKFDGFAQQKQVWSTKGQFNIVNRDAALVIPYNEHFRNLWGESFLTAVYPLWIWYEIVLRTMARYLERQAMPVTVGRAPMRGTVNVNGKTEPVGAMDLILSVATNVAKSNAVAIPSDRDPETKEYLFDISYLVSAERGGEFIKALEFLGQEMIKAGLSADRSLTQSSGGVGSYNIGEVHAEASAMSALMIELQLLFYLNRYFMPGYSLYNRGVGGPPIWLRTQSIDQRDRQLLMSLVSVAGNSTGGQEFFDMIDFRTMGNTSNIPILSEADVKKRVEERQQQSLDNQEAQQKMMMKFADVSKPAIPSKKPAEQENKFEQAMAAFYKLEHMPWILGPGDIETLRLHGLITDEQYQLFNPFHDGLGRFASRRGGGGAGNSKSRQQGVVEKSTTNKLNESVNLPQGVSLKRIAGTTLKLGAYGTVGLVILSALTSKSTTSIEIPADFDYDLPDDEIDNRPKLSMDEALSIIDPYNFDPSELDKYSMLDEDRLKLKDMIQRVQSGQVEAMHNQLNLSQMPSFDNINAAKAWIQDQYAAKGLPVPPDVPILLDKGLFYYPGQYKIGFTADGLAAFDGISDDADIWYTHALAHEMGHSLQDGGNYENTGRHGLFGLGAAWKWELRDENGNPTNTALFMEGRGELLARLALSSYEVNAGPGSRQFTKTTATAAGIAVAGAAQQGVGVVDYISQTNRYYTSANQMSEYVLYQLFPNQMQSYMDMDGSKDFPSDSEIQTWLQDSYGINSNQAFEDLMNEFNQK